jgi:glycosyltransferase involved in cell wall biosynthesis
VCLYDDVDDGHHTGYMEGIARALLAAGVEVLACSPVKPPSLSTQPADSWFEVSTIGLRQVKQGRRQLHRVAALCQTQDVDSIWELNLDKNVWALPSSLERTRTRIHVLHHAHQYTYAHRSNLGKVRTAVLRRRLARLTGRSARVVVHTNRAKDVLSGFVSEERITAQPYPVTSASQSTPEPPRNAPAGTPRLLFVGQARSEKGLPVLLEAIQNTQSLWSLDIVGKQKPDVRRDLEARFPMDRVQWIDRFVNDEELRRHYAEASLLVLPYRASFGDDGGASGVLLEGLGAGIPLLTTPTLQDQLPPDYPGAVVAASHEPGALATSLESSRGRLASLQKGALEAGPAYIRSHHTYEAYVATLLELI